MPALTDQIMPNELAQIVEAVFTTMIGLEVTRCEVPWFPGEDRITAKVYLAGDWNGAVLVECDGKQACRFAGRFLSQDPPKSVDDVVCDVAGELANMIGGNLKCALSRGIRLSMPSIAHGSDFVRHGHVPAVLHRLAFGCDEGVFWITLAAN